MSRSNYQTLIDRGRKAGLRTSDLYSAIASRRPEGSEDATGRADCNGFVSVFTANGRREFHPVSSRTRA